MSEHDKLAGIKPGDRVRVTFEGEMRRSARNVISLNHAGYIQNFGDECMDDPTFQIERIEPPLAVGDRVKLDNEDCAGSILCVYGAEAWIKWDHLDSPQEWELSRLERIA